MLKNIQTKKNTVISDLFPKKSICFGKKKKNPTGFTFGTCQSLSFSRLVTYQAYELKKIDI